jgi:hypothetical protein
VGALELGEMVVKQLKYDFSYYHISEFVEFTEVLIFFNL